MAQRGLQQPGGGVLVWKAAPCGRLCWDMQPGTQSGGSKGNLPLGSHKLVFLKARVSSRLVGETLATWLGNQRYCYCKPAHAVKHSYWLRAARALGMLWSHCAHVCNTKVQFRISSSVCLKLLTLLTASECLESRF